MMYDILFVSGVPLLGGSVPRLNLDFEKRDHQGSLPVPGEVAVSVYEATGES